MPTMIYWYMLWQVIVLMAMCLMWLSFISWSIGKTINTSTHSHICGNMSVESIPRDLRHLRACLLCSLIKVCIHCMIVLINETIVCMDGVVDVLWMCWMCWCDGQSFDQFEFDGCDNCDEYLGMKNNREMVYDCTSSNFDGSVSKCPLCPLSPCMSKCPVWQCMDVWSPSTHTHL